MIGFVGFFCELFGISGGIVVIDVNCGMCIVLFEIGFMLVIVWLWISGVVFWFMDIVCGWIGMFGCFYKGMILCVSDFGVFYCEGVGKGYGIGWFFVIFENGYDFCVLVFFGS